MSCRLPWDIGSEPCLLDKDSLKLALQLVLTLNQLESLRKALSLQNWWSSRKATV